MKNVNLIRTLCHQAYKNYSPELLLGETKNIKLLLNKNRYPQELVDKTILLHLKSWDKIKILGPEKCLLTLNITFINKS